VHEEGSNEEMIALKVRSASAVINELSLAHYDLLHVNCEGCETDMYENLAENDLFRKFRYIGHSFHNYDQPNLRARYCRYVLFHVPYR
jgi:hypothetical protein